MHTTFRTSLRWSLFTLGLAPVLVLAAVPTALAFSPGDCNGSNGTVSCLLQVYLNPFIALLAALVGVVTVAGVIWGTIMYIQSGGDPGKAEAAKRKITTSLIGLVAFLVLFVFLQFLAPFNL